MQALHEAISALSLQLFNSSFKLSSAEVCKCYLSLTHPPHTFLVEVDNFFLLYFYSQNLMLQQSSAVH